MEMTRGRTQSDAYVGIRKKVPDPGPLFDSALPALFGFVMSNRVSVVGPPLGIYHRVDETGFDMTVALPVSGEVPEPDAPITAGMLPAVDVAIRIHFGAYDGLSESWRRLTDEVKAAGFELGDECWERYESGPESGDDPSQWRTVLVQPIVVPEG